MQMVVGTFPRLSSENGVRRVDAKKGVGTLRSGRRLVPLTGIEDVRMYTGAWLAEFTSSSLILFGIAVAISRPCLWLCSFLQEPFVRETISPGLCSHLAVSLAPSPFKVHDAGSGLWSTTTLKSHARMPRRVPRSLPRNCSYDYFRDSDNHARDNDRLPN